MTGRLRNALCSALLVMSACEDNTSGFVVLSIEPSTSTPDTSTQVAIGGEGFMDAVSISLEEGNSVAFDRAWSVAIGDVDAEAVMRRSSSVLEATVPAGLPVGVYDVTVVSPRGTVVVLADAFAVATDSAGLRVVIESEADGTGSPVLAQTLDLGAAFPVHANLRDGNDWVGPAVVTWSVEGGIGSVQEDMAASTVFEAQAVGTGRITAVHATAEGAATGVITVTDPAPGPLATLQVVPDTLTATADDATTAFSVMGFDEQGRRVTELGTISWSIGAGAITAIDPVTGVFDPTVAGEGFVVATSSLGPSDQTGLITVLPGAVAALVVAPENLAAQQNGPSTMFTAIGTDADGNGTSNLGVLTWSTTGTVGSIDSTGLFTPDTVGTGSVRVVSSLGPSDQNTNVTVQPQAAALTELATDPFGDGTGFAHVFGHNGKVVLGPGRNGDAAVRMDPDGSNPESLSFSFFGDVTGNSHRNDASPPYSSLGRPFCSGDSLECGPDNESARALFRAGQIAGVNWTIAGGGRALPGDLDYIYMTTDNDSTLDFSYVDLSGVTGPQTRGVTAIHVFNDDVYVGLSDSGGGRPFLVRVQTVPTPPGLDAGGGDAINLKASDLPNIQDSSLVMIDTIWDFNGRIYLANEHGWYRGAVARPGPADSDPGDWVEITPTDPAYGAKTSTGTFLSTDLSPSNRAVPQMAVFRGRLYAGRNTSDGPQLWGCDPARSASPMDCDGGDWQLVAGNSTGDAQLTQFNNPGNDDIGFLAATSASLYVGFNNNTDGVTVLRAITATPINRGDFVGAGDCSADGHPATCAGIGGNGFGSGVQGFADAVSLNFGASEGVYVAAAGADVAVYQLTP